MFLHGMAAGPPGGRPRFLANGDGGSRDESFSRLPGLRRSSSVLTLVLPRRKSLRAQPGGPEGTIVSGTSITSFRGIAGIVQPRI
jgi:hypothetical protein